MKFTLIPRLGARAPWILAALIMSGCASTPEPVPAPPRLGNPEVTEVEAVLDAVERSIEQHDLAGVLRHVSVYYRDGEGNDYSKMRTFLATMFNSYGPIDVERTETKITVQDTHAEVYEKFQTRATAQAGYGGSDVDETGSVKVRLERVAGDWLITEWVAAAER